MIGDISAIIVAVFMIVFAIVGASWKLSNVLRGMTKDFTDKHIELALEVRGHNKRLDAHKDILDKLEKEIKTLNINSNQERKCKS